MRSLMSILLPEVLKMTNKTLLGLWVDESFKKKMVRQAKKEGMTTSAYVCLIIKAGLSQFKQNSVEEMLTKREVKDE